MSEESIAQRGERVKRGRREGVRAVKCSLQVDDNGKVCVGTVRMNQLCAAMMSARTRRLTNGSTVK